jgi:acetyltransferase-like isoleucine patch superfamily enzyme
MSISNYIPTTIKRHISLLKKRKQYPTSKIDSPFIGQNVKLGKNSGVYENAVIDNGVEIGDFSYINTGTNIASGIIGKYTSIGSNCQIGMYEHPINYVSTSPYFYQSWRNILGTKENLWNEIKNPPSIGNDVWIGNNSVILQGVKIGDGAVIAAGAVVTKDVDPYAVVGGVPAKPLRKRFTDEQISYLLNLKWWDMGLEELKEYKSLFESKDNWVEIALSKRNKVNV